MSLQASDITRGEQMFCFRNDNRQPKTQEGGIHDDQAGVGEGEGETCGEEKDV